jgi:O-6-methylguanine DNA methyltransferase
MPGSRKDKKIFRHIVNYSGLKIELCSDSINLLGVNFVKEKKPADKTCEFPEPIKKAISLLDNYFRGNPNTVEIVLVSKNSPVNEIDGPGSRLFLDMDGYTEKEVQVYRELLKVKAGKLVSYGELASRSGFPRGARFIGNCMAKNRFPVIIPCHRVIKGDGSTGNCSSGPEVKELLLKHESNSL